MKDQDLEKLINHLTQNKKALQKLREKPEYKYFNSLLTFAYGDIDGAIINLKEVKKEIDGLQSL